MSTHDQPAYADLPSAIWAEDTELWFRRDTDLDQSIFRPRED